jgi:hypothetical protein
MIEKQTRVEMAFELDLKNEAALPDETRDCPRRLVARILFAASGMYALLEIDVVCGNA